MRGTRTGMDIAQLPLGAFADLNEELRDDREHIRWLSLSEHSVLQ